VLVNSLWGDIIKDKHKGNRCQEEKTMDLEFDGMREQKILQTSMFGGFDKKQVLEYIDRLREENRQNQADLQTNLDEMVAARQEQSKQVEDFKLMIVQMESQIQSSSDRIKQLTDTVQSLNSQIEGYKEKLLQSEKSASMHLEKYNEIANKAELYEEKANRYDELSNAVGDIILEAKQRAKLIEDEADKKVRLSDEYARGSLDRVSAELKSLRVAVEKIKSNTTAVMDELNNRTHTIEEILDAVEQTKSQSFESQDAINAEDNTQGVPFANEQDIESNTEEQFFR
jgi:DNA repair exonuclease SbcCD ATPase subunit